MPKNVITSTLPRCAMRCHTWARPATTARAEQSRSKSRPHAAASFKASRPDEKADENHIQCNRPSSKTHPRKPETPTPMQCTYTCFLLMVFPPAVARAFQLPLPSTQLQPFSPTWADLTPSLPSYISIIQNIPKTTDTSNTSISPRRRSTASPPYFRFCPSSPTPTTIATSCLSVSLDKPDLLPSMHYLALHCVALKALGTPMPSSQLPPIRMPTLQHLPSPVLSRPKR
ncbi:hypothetical protein B0T16DRAFT_46030 [Cercophora newfieldiana]|uniref:Uncharacterized protein n=1 Tax=Cercophora newfieldiana TaxID=92897 RepID=A0AA40D1I1_9PEZI|nr:hypothetical protein B0T16DRAFT_46030 [Cercophora newfieldiana]